MPVHAVLLISVKIAKQGVEGVASVLFNLVLQREQHRMPLQSTGQEKGQTVYMIQGGSHREKQEVQNQSRYKQGLGISKPFET